jgi:putative ABC transport system permease protein
MNLIAIKMLVGDKLKYFGLLAGMAFAAMMIAQQASIFVGLKNQTGTFIRENNAVDLWVMDDQVRFSEDQKPIPDTTLQRIRSIEGVEWAVPLFKGWLRARLADGTRMQVIVVGLDDATMIGAPPEMIDGKITDLRQDRAVIMDVKDAGTKLKLEKADVSMKVGDAISINDNEVTVVGTYKSAPSFFWDPILYTTYSRAVQIAPRERSLMSFVMLKVKPGVEIAEVQRRINTQTRFIARTGAEFEKLTSSYILEKTGILVNFGMAIGLGFIIGLIVTGQTFFNFTLDNLRYFASLKAMGTSAGTLIRMVLVQVTVACLIAFGLGIGIASVTGQFIKKTDLAFDMPWQVLAGTGGAMLAVAMLAACISLIKVLRLEAGVVFK